MVGQSKVLDYIDLTEKSLNQSKVTEPLDNEDKSLNDNIKFRKSLNRSESESHDKLSEEKDLPKQIKQPEGLNSPSELTDTQVLHNIGQNISSGTVLIDDNTSVTNLVKTEDTFEILKDQADDLETGVNGFNDTTEDSTEILKGLADDLETRVNGFNDTTGSPLHNIPKSSVDVKYEPDFNKVATCTRALEVDNNSVEGLSDFGFCELEDKENLIHSTESSKCLSCDIVENNWPFVIDNNVIVNFHELEDKCFEDGDFSFFLKESDTGQVGLYLKYYVNGSYREVLIPEGAFGKLFTMEWKDDFLSESSEDLGASLQNCLVSLEDSVDKLRWENVVASMGPFHHGNVRLKHSLMTRPGNSAGASNANHESAFPKHVFSSDSGYNRNSPGGDSDTRPANFRDVGDNNSVGQQRWQNASYRSAISTNSQGKHDCG